MRHLPKLQLLLFVFAWVLGLTWGSGGILAMTGLLLGVQLVLWRAELPRAGSLRRLWSRRREPRHPVPSYDALRHSIRMGAHSRREFDFGMRRRLARVASARLADSHGLDPHRDPEASRALLGDTAWTLLDPRRPISTERSRDGVPEATLTRIVDRLEQL